MYFPTTAAPIISAVLKYGALMIATGVSPDQEKLLEYLIELRGWT